MTKIITTILAIAIVVLDFIAYRRLKRSGASKVLRYSFKIAILFSYILIILVPFFMFKFINIENNQCMMKFSMAILTGYLFFTISRLFLYLFWLPTKRKALMWAGIAVSSFLLLSFIYGAFVTRTDYEIKKISIQFSNLPRSFNGYKIAFISDIHIGSMWNAENELKKLVKSLNSTGADIILFGGDLVNLHHMELSPNIIDILSGVKAPYGVFAVLGNHDTGSYIKNSTERFREDNIASLVKSASHCGWSYLRDSTIYINNGTDSISITGIDYSDELLGYKHSFKAIDDFEVGHIYENIPSNLFNITISHLPQLWYKLCDGGYSDLTLSGHIHAMQIKIGSLSPASFMYDEWSGLYERAGGKLYINDGIGSVGFFARIGARPEITVIELQSQP